VRGLLYRLLSDPDPTWFVLLVVLPLLSLGVILVSHLRWV